MEVGCEQECGERVEHEYRYRRNDFGLSSTAANALGTCVGVVALERAEEGDPRAENRRLNDTIDYLEWREREAKSLGECRARDIRRHYSRQVSGADSDRILQDGQNRQHYHSRDEPRNNQIH